MVNKREGCQQLFLCVVFPFGLQLAGTVYPYWIHEDGINKGLFHEVHQDMSIRGQVMGMETASIGLHISASVLLLGMVVNSFMRLYYLSGSLPAWTSKYIKINRLAYRGNMYLYFPSSLLILAGCILFGNNHPLEMIGMSFYMCLSACLVMWLVTCLCICDQLCKERRANHVFDTMLVQMYRM